MYFSDKVPNTEMWRKLCDALDHSCKKHRYWNKNKKACLLKIKKKTKKYFYNCHYAFDNLYDVVHWQVRRGSL